MSILLIIWLISTKYYPRHKLVTANEPSLYERLVREYNLYYRIYEKEEEEEEKEYKNNEIKAMHRLLNERAEIELLWGFYFVHAPTRLYYDDIPLYRGSGVSCQPINPMSYLGSFSDGQIQSD